ncbi:MAG: ABC transporter substrate-binding protein, partial [Ignisphaera sp.]
MHTLNRFGVTLLLIVLLLLNIILVPSSIVRGERASFSVILWVTLPPVINWNPFAPGSILTGGGMLSQGGVHSFCVAPLFVLIPYKGYQDVILPMLGKDIRINPAENYLEITLWNDAHWYDGKSLYPFTAKDVWTYFTVQWKIFRNFIPFLLDVKIVDDYTVRFYFNITVFRITAPLYDYRLGKVDVSQMFRYSFMPRMRFSDLVSIFTWHMTTPYQIFGKYAEMVADVPVNEVPKRFNLTKLQDEVRNIQMDKPWCNGPFWADPATLTTTGVKLVKNPGYRWAKYVQYDEGEILFARAEEHMVAWMIEGRNLDTWHGISPLTLVEINKAPGGVRIAWVQSRELWGIWFNLNKYPFNVTYVRQAITMLINSTEAALAYPPQVLPFKDYITSLMTTEGIPEWIKKNLYEWTYNPQKAYQLLEGVGFRRGPDGKWYTPKGEPFRFTIMCVSQWADFVALAANLASQLQQHGIEAEMGCVDVGVYWSMWMEWRFDITLSWTAGSWTVPLSMAGINGFINSFYPAWDFTISKFNLTWPVTLKNGTVI